MSAEEKRKTILSIYHKTKTVYTEKEILTLASKAGVNANTYVRVNRNCIMSRKSINPCARLFWLSRQDAAALVVPTRYSFSLSSLTQRPVAVPSFFCFFFRFPHTAWRT